MSATPMFSPQGIESFFNRLLNLLKPFQQVTANTNRLSIDVNSLPTLSTVTTVTTVATMTNMTNIAGVTAFTLLLDSNRSGYNTGVRANL